MSQEVVSDLMSVILVQFAPKKCGTMEEVTQNTDRVVEYLERAVTCFPGIDMVVFPEGTFQGSGTNFGMDAPLTWDAEPVRRVCAKCRELEIWGVFTGVFQPGNGDFIENTCFIVNDQGEIVHRYVKMNPFIPGETTHPGDRMPVCQGPKGSRIATLICADGVYQEAWREAAHQGANLILHPSNWPAPYEAEWRISNQGGAYFNNVTVLAVNAVGQDGASISCGSSMFINSSGALLQEAPRTGEWLLRADFSPKLEDHMAMQYIGANRVWESAHRGASSPGMGGQGLGYDDYTVYKKEG